MYTKGARIEKHEGGYLVRFDSDRGEVFITETSVVYLDSEYELLETDVKNHLTETENGNPQADNSQDTPNSTPV